MEHSTKWFRFSSEDGYKVRDRLASLGYVANSYGFDADFAIIKEGRADLFKYYSYSLRGYLNPQEITIAEALQLEDTGCSHFNMELSDGKLTSVVNTSYAPKTLEKQIDEVLPDMWKIQRGHNTPLPRKTETIHDDYMLPDVDEDDMSYDGDGPSAPFMPPCRCPSLLGGHEEGCAWHPVPDERDVERQRLEAIWGIPNCIQQPKEAPSYMTASDFKPRVYGIFSSKGGKKC